MQTRASTYGGDGVENGVRFIDSDIFRRKHSHSHTFNHSFSRVGQHLTSRFYLCFGVHSLSDPINRFVSAYLNLETKT